MIESTSSCTNLSASKLNFVIAHGTIACRTDAPGMSACLFSHASSRRGNARCLRHAADAGRQIHHALALGHGELTEQEERLARLGGDPVRVAATGVQIGKRRLLRALRRSLGEEILDLERAELLVLRQIQVVHRCFLRNSVSEALLRKHQNDDEAPHREQRVADRVRAPCSRASECRSWRRPRPSRPTPCWYARRRRRPD